MQYKDNTTVLTYDLIHLSFDTKLKKGLVESKTVIAFEIYCDIDFLLLF